MLQSSFFDTESPHVWSVRALNAYIRQILETDINLRDVWLEGEVSNWKQAASGHIYFTLKDSGANIHCVIWRSQASRLLYLPQQDGEAVLAHGHISVYEAGGNYQFYVDDLEPAGQGALYAQFEQIKARLQAEGLFEAALKKPLPPFPQQIGVVTSPDAAALRDIINVLRRRYPLARLLLVPTQVQGESAPDQIIAALNTITQQPVDVIILARGGGSLEDLWAFNNESLARTIAACAIPVVTGIGHETDFTIADFVADLRAPTPSAAAELVTPNKFELQQKVTGYQLELGDHARQTISEARSRLGQLTWALSRLSPQAYVDNYRQQIDNLADGAARIVRHQIALHRQQSAALAAQLKTLDPQATLSRGYAIVQKGKEVVTQTGQVSPGQAITIKVSDGQFEADVSG